LINRTPLLLGTSAVAGDVFRDADSIAEDHRRFRIGRPHVEIHVGSLAGKTLLVAGTHAAAPFHDHSVGNHLENVLKNCRREIFGLTLKPSGAPISTTISLGSHLIFFRSSLKDLVTLGELQATVKISTIRSKRFENMSQYAHKQPGPVSFCWASWR
jgi:hypothetical protein